MAGKEEKFREAEKKQKKEKQKKFLGMEDWGSCYQKEEDVKEYGCDLGEENEEMGS